MNAHEKQAARDRIAALRARWERAQALKARYASYVTTLEESAAHDKYLVALESLVDELTRPEPEDLCLKRRVAVWNAINQYVEACGRRSGDGVYGNVARQNAVVMVERALRGDPEPEDLTRDDRDECVVCHCALDPTNAPPRCLDCVPTDDDVADWESRRQITRDLERSITKARVERACGVKRNVRVRR